MSPDVSEADEGKIYPEKIIGIKIMKYEPLI